MAKITARGARAVAEARYTHQTTETVEVLCSDGRILHKTIWRDAATGRLIHATGYLLARKLIEKVTPESVTRWVDLMLTRKWSARVL
jgi:hypothetical protein